MAVVILDPEQQLFAADALAQGRFRDLDDLVNQAIKALRAIEFERAAFLRTLDDAIEEGEQEGFHRIEDVSRDMRAMVREIARGRA